ncbi:natural killer cell receptor 2B4-like isoform X2 [Rhea pennata]|uniref:natural killer cell receptor 2B4-like isoform X2 n=1 Tax=Rhea pennata TaxID=8795 RepID=UPI002E269137
MRPARAGSRQQLPGQGQLLVFQALLFPVHSSSSLQEPGAQQCARGLRLSRGGGASRGGCAGTCSEGKSRLHPAPAAPIAGGRLCLLVLGAFYRGSARALDTRGWRGKQDRAGGGHQRSFSAVRRSGRRRPPCSPAGREQGPKEPPDGAIAGSAGRQGRCNVGRPRPTGQGSRGLPGPSGAAGGRAPSPGRCCPCSALAPALCKRPGCEDVAVAVGAALRLVPQNWPQHWESIDWRVRLDAGEQLRILTARRGSGVVERPPVSPFSQRTDFEWETHSLRVDPVSKADGGVYSVHFMDSKSSEISQRSFCVSVQAPVCRPALEARVVQREHGWCNVSLACAVPCAGNVTYSWRWAGAAPEALGQRLSLQLRLRADANGTVYLCNASNAVSWAAASTDVSALCSPAELWWTLAVALGLLLAISVALALAWRCRRRRGPVGNTEEPLTVYEEVGSARHSRDRNGSSEVALVGNTIYTTVCSKTPGPGCPQKPENHTIYATVQPRKGPPSIKTKRIEPSLTSTAYAEPVEACSRWRVPLRPPPPAPAGPRLA